MLYCLHLLFYETGFTAENRAVGAGLGGIVTNEVLHGPFSFQSFISKSEETTELRFIRGVLRAAGLAEISIKPSGASV